MMHGRQKYTQTVHVHADVLSRSSHRLVRGGEGGGWEESC